MRSMSKFATVVAVLALSVGAALAAQQRAVKDAGDSNSPANIEVLQIRPNVYMIAGAGANITVQFGADGVVVVDAGLLEKSDAVLDAIRKLTGQPIRYVIDTSADPDHVGGNEHVSKAGRTLFQTNNPLGEGMTNGGAAAILSAEKVLTRMSAPTGQVSPFPTAAWPTETFNQKRKYMYLNGEGIEVLHQPAAHTDGDSVVFFRRSDVVVAGDILDTTTLPGDRRRARRQHPGRDRRAQPARRPGDPLDSARVAGRRAPTSSPGTAASATSSTSSTTATW